jgi:hypothetical protein
MLKDGLNLKFKLINVGEFNYALKFNFVGAVPDHTILPQTF